MDFVDKKTKEITMVPCGVHPTPSEFGMRYPTRPKPPHPRTPQRNTGKRLHTRRTFRKRLFARDFSRETLQGRRFYEKDISRERDFAREESYSSRTYIWSFNLVAIF